MSGGLRLDQIMYTLLTLSATIMDIIFWEFLILYQIFFSPQVKQSVIVSNKHGTYELSHELPNNLGLRILVFVGFHAHTRKKKT